MLARRGGGAWLVYLAFSLPLFSARDDSLPPVVMTGLFFTPGVTRRPLNLLFASVLQAARADFWPRSAAFVAALWPQNWLFGAYLRLDALIARVQRRKSISDWLHACSPWPAPCTKQRALRPLCRVRLASSSTSSCLLLDEGGTTRSRNKSPETISKIDACSRSWREAAAARRCSTTRGCSASTKWSALGVPRGASTCRRFHAIDATRFFDRRSTAAATAATTP